MDDIYMPAVQTMTGSGGWPLSLFLTPDGKPFYGGTYFPPDDRWGRPGFLALLEAIARRLDGRGARSSRPRRRELLAHLETDAEGRAGGAARAGAGGSRRRRARRSSGSSTRPTADSAARRSFRPRCGSSSCSADSAAHGRRRRRARWPRRRSTKMAAGGMYDQVGGGFHRYSVDARWLVPHFEKMLYDNAMLARVYVLAFRAFGNPDARPHRARDARLPAARDDAARRAASSRRRTRTRAARKGTFYVWNPESLADAVGADAAPDRRRALRRHRARATSRSGETVLSVVRSRRRSSRRTSAAPRRRSRAILAEARAEDVRRPRRGASRPATDDKLLTDWTALAISAFALAARVLERAALRGRPRAAPPTGSSTTASATAGSSTARRPAGPTFRASRPTTRT